MRARAALAGGPLPGLGTILGTVVHGQGKRPPVTGRFGVRARGVPVSVPAAPRVPRCARSVTQVPGMSPATDITDRMTTFHVPERRADLDALVDE